MEASCSLSLRRERSQTVLLNTQGARASFPSFTARPQLGKGKAIYIQVTSVLQILQAQKEGDEVLYLGGGVTNIPQNWCCTGILVSEIPAHGGLVLCCLGKLPGKLE